MKFSHRSCRRSKDITRTGTKLSKGRAVIERLGEATNEKPPTEMEFFTTMLDATCLCKMISLAYHNWLNEAPAKCFELFVFACLPPSDSFEHAA